MHAPIEIGYQAFVSDSAEEFGAVRKISADGSELTLWVENAGEFKVSDDAVSDVREGKVTFDCARLDRQVKDAIGHAHDAETL